MDLRTKKKKKKKKGKRKKKINDRSIQIIKIINYFPLFGEPTKTDEKYD